MNEKRFCRDCSFLIPGSRPDLEYATCSHEAAIKSQMSEAEFLVRGVRTVPEYLYCATMRLGGAACGPEGALWAEREKVTT